MAEMSTNGKPPYQNLDEVDCRCLDQICSNCANRAIFFSDMAEAGLPVEEYQAENNRIHHIAQQFRNKAFPGGSNV